MAVRNAVTAKPMTIAVRISAWGRVSAYSCGSRPRTNSGARPTPPEARNSSMMAPLLISMIPSRMRVRLRSSTR